MARVPVTVLLNFGDQSELVIPDFKITDQNPIRVPAAEVAAAIGLATGELPGKHLTAEVTETPETGVVVTGYELA
ncbi:hypothetical protein EDD29_0089 [Actinocorallia herbida]|uniref:Uncharacterized protein n=1 Tax=Actinocorallia herbida TaxID=58109 RepID=A0A3N1CPF8_9ACTN|nr:hypothetical protein [Actinocorallia herbida]ROO82608.1 hypothetical protein EDD29_0089 [Actinocorallia herbida]